MSALQFTTVLYPNLFWQKYFPGTSGYIVGGEPLLYQFLRRQPNDIRIASLTEEANNLPTFAGRSVLVAKTYADPYM